MLPQIMTMERPMAVMMSDALVLRMLKNVCHLRKPRPRPNMAKRYMAAKTTIATVHEIVPLGSLDPECVVTPGIFVQRIVRIDRVATSAGGFRLQA